MTEWMTTPPQNSRAPRAPRALGATGQVVQSCSHIGPAQRAKRAQTKMERAVSQAQEARGAHMSLPAGSLGRVYQ
jgi:hypothetical protein